MARSSLSLGQARRLALGGQGLLTLQPFGTGCGAVLRAIDQIGYVQIDTISVVERAHHHTLRSRCPGYHPRFLHSLQFEQRKIFEYWSHAAAYLPIEDYRFYLPRMLAIREGKKHWFRPDHQLMRYVLDRVRSDGPVSARDFEHSKNPKGGWWEWKPAKRALEQLFIQGELMVVRRRNFQKVYDLPERVLPPEIDKTLPSQEEHCRFLIRRAFRAHGVAQIGELSYGLRGLVKGIRQTLGDMLGAGEVVPVQVGLLSARYYSTPAILSRLGSLRLRRRLRILSPFDNLVIQRSRLAKLFGFDFQLECYLPRHKRKFGYFSLPMLWGDEFIGRLDCKADRKAQRLTVNNLVFEPHFEGLDAVFEPLTSALQGMAEENSCNQVRIQGVTPSKIRAKLIRAL